MRHLKIFEDYNDEVSGTARDWFDLTHEIELDNGYKLTGPIENKDEAEKIVRKIHLEFFKFPDDVYDVQDKILDNWKSSLDEIGYTYPEYKVGVIEYDDNTIKLYRGKEYEEISDIDSSVDYTPMIGHLFRKMGATHVHSYDGDEILVPIDRFPDIQR
jgi:hypothetical protein